MPKTISPNQVWDCYLFSGMTQQEKGELLKEGHISHYSRGEYLFQHGDAIQNFHIVCSGTVQLFRQTPDGRQFTTGVIAAGRSIGEAEIFTTIREHQLSAVAVDDVVTMKLHMAWIKESAKKYSAMALNLLAELSKQSQMASVSAEHQATMTAAQRITCFFQQVCVLHDADPRGFELPYSKTLIASRLGIEPETFSRALTKIRDYGITVNGTHVCMV